MPDEPAADAAGPASTRPRRAIVFPFASGASASYSVLMFRRAATFDRAGTWEGLVADVPSVDTAGGEPATLLTARGLLKRVAISADTLYVVGCEHVYDPTRDIVADVPVFAAHVSSQRSPRLEPIHADFEWVPLAECAGRVAFEHEHRALLALARMLASGFPSERWRKVPAPPAS